MKTLIFIILVCTIFSCSSVRHITPLNKNESAVNLSLGGPVTEVGKIYMPLPLSGCGYSYGITQNFSIESGINFTSMLYGILHIDAGVKWYPFIAKNAFPGLFVTPRLFFTTDFKHNRLFPDLDAGMYWKFKNHLPYTGIESWFEFHKKRSDGNIQKNNCLLIPYLGYGYKHKRWQYQFEMRLYTPNLKNTGRVTKHIGFCNHGILGFFIGISRVFGRN